MFYIAVCFSFFKIFFDWFTFLEDVLNDLLLLFCYLTAIKLSKSCQNARKDPFIINHWFDILKKTVKNLRLEDRPDLLWNADELGVPHDHKKCKVFSLRGEPTY